jgi:hypothetical protein
MSIYPQLITGAISQFPISRRLQRRTVVNRLADNSAVKLADPTGGSTAWQLQYAGITDAELVTLQQFFESCEGSLNGFTYLDPAGNLLAWSEDLADTVWQPDPFTAITSGVSDPFGGTNGFSLVNSGGAAQGVTQTLNAPGGYIYTLSVYVKATIATSVTLSIGDQTKIVSAAVNWSRVSFTTTGDPTAAAVPFAVECPPGSVDIFGPQVEPQPAASAYKKSSTGGVYQNARFQNDALTGTATAANENSVTVNILYANHL